MKESMKNNINDNMKNRRNLFMRQLVMGFVLLGILASITACGDTSSQTSTTGSVSTKAEGMATTESDTQGETRSAVGSDETSVAGTGASSRTSANGISYILLTTRDMYENEWQMNESGQNFDLVLNAEYDILYLHDENYTTLDSFIEMVNTKSANVIETYKNEYLEEAKAYFADTANQDMDITLRSTPYTLLGTTSVKRSDSAIVSIAIEYYHNANSAHPTIARSSAAVDPQTGQTLSLADVCDDYDGLYEYVLEFFSNDDYREGLFDDYEDIIKAEFYPDGVEAAMPEGGMTWYLDHEGLCIIFGQYVVAPYAYGEAHISLTYDEARRFLKDEYIASFTNIGYHLENYGSVTFTIPDTGETKTVSLSAYDDESFDEEGYSLGVTTQISIDVDGKLLGDSELETTFADAYVLVNGQNAYLYVQLSGMNDYQYIKIYDLTTDVPSYVDTREGSFMGTAIYDTNRFALAKVTHVLSSSSSYGWYQMASDGTPQLIGDTYYVMNKENDTSLTLIKDMNVKVLDGDTLTDGVLEAGIIIYPKYIGTDDYIICDTSDGRRVRIDYTTDEMFRRLIDGVYEEEYFEFMPYAG